ncbi:MAG: DUF2577 domain-containing protein [Oscillospiraceae bacterium]|nr:DUF2577 domain-containing protein [Oscillospiraceae bacterium]
MSELLGVVQKIVQNSMEGMKLTDLVFGTVQSASPLAVQIESTMQAIPAAALILTEGVQARSYTGTTSDGASFTVPINPGLAPGDKVIMLRTSRGQRFIILSKVW